MLTGAEAPKHSSYGTGLGVRRDFPTGPGLGLICPVSPKNVSVLCLSHHFCHASYEPLVFILT